ncbi:hypothetical protein NKI96_10605 [Mesorhizobium sp. M0292]
MARKARRTIERNRQRRLAMLGNVAIGAAMLIGAAGFMAWAAAFGAML